MFIREQVKDQLDQRISDHVPLSQNLAWLRSAEASVADAMSNDVRRGGLAGPAFFFHLGDVVYYFGEGRYYYDQFYEPFRAYDRPIFAIPGNHDGMVFGTQPDTPKVPTLTAFLRNFCADRPRPSPDSGAIVRTTMTQPGAVSATQLAKSKVANRLDFHVNLLKRSITSGLPFAITDSFLLCVLCGLCVYQILETQRAQRARRAYL